MQRYECKTCGAELKWDPNAGALKCEYCNSEFQPSDFEDKTVDADSTVSEELDAKYTNAGQDLDEDMVVYACKECGAEVVTSKTTMATTCAYCGRAISITSKSAGNFRPEKAIPFAIDKEKAMAIFQEYTKKSILSPKTFSEQHTVEKMQGLFVPFFLHSIKLHGTATIEGEHVSSRRSGDDKITTHKVYEIDTQGNGTFDNIPVDGSVKLDNMLMDALEPYSYDKITNYNPAYMAGYFAEQPDETAESTKPRADERAKKAIEENLLNVAGNYSSKRVVNSSTTTSERSSIYAMLPVWLLNVDYNGKKHLFAINGETGKVVGKLPLSKARVALAAIIPFILTQIVAYIFA